MTSAFAATAGLLFAVGLYGLLAPSALLTRLLGANITSAAVFLYLLATGAAGDGPPDPVPQAMVLTGIVITISLTAFALVLLRILDAHDRCEDVDDDREDARDDVP